MPISFLDITMMPQIATFLFVFAIMYGILTYAKILGFAKGVNVIIAVVIGFFATAYEPFVYGMSEYMPFIAVVFLVVFFILFLKKIFSSEKGDKHIDALPIGIALAALLMVLAIMWDRVSMYVPAGFDASNILWIIGILIVVAIFWLAYRQKPSS